MGMRVVKIVSLQKRVWAVILRGIDWLRGKEVGLEDTDRRVTDFMESYSEEVLEMPPEFEDFVE